jgi:hypothetical protein
MNMRIAALSLLVLCLAVTGFAQNIFSEGPIDGNDNASFVTGPNNPNFLGSVQDISNGFVATNSGIPFTLEWGAVDVIADRSQVAFAEGSVSDRIAFA